MVTAPAFDAATWIAQNTYGGTRLTPEATAAVANFTMMWNLFEGIVCGNDANVRQFEVLAAGLSKAAVALDAMNSIEDCLAFWTLRYRTPEGFADRFLELYFRNNDRREVVEEVLLGQRQSLSDKVLALMLIVYRLRNNLFHGLKTLEMLNDQVHNLNTASRCLGVLMTLSHSHLVTHSSRR
jgi:hypothetical protein